MTNNPKIRLKGENMELLYSTTTIYTYEEYKRFNHMLMFYHKSILLHIIVEAWILFVAVSTKEIFVMMLSVVYPVIILMLPVFLNIHSKKIWKSNKSAQDLNVKFDFYETFFIETDEHGETKLEYNKLYKIIETKTNFYLMLSKNQGLILNKINLPEGLDKFLKNIKVA